MTLVSVKRLDRMGDVFGRKAESTRAIYKKPPA